MLNQLLNEPALTYASSRRGGFGNNSVTRVFGSDRQNACRPYARNACPVWYHRGQWRRPWPGHAYFGPSDRCESSSRDATNRGLILLSCHADGEAVKRLHGLKSLSLALELEAAKH